MRCGYILKVGPRGFPKLLDIGCERKSGVKYDSWVWGLSTRKERLS